ncbi:hypothetical protein [Mucilaginibacter sp. BT774]|uniref:hypothetical protein n=1 Tax=Mucilaginibacter sp. BT774 TaxID=3062276 RepID=UPI0026743F93|nr:hypothetical protein [Mucilaginibacter sp. BT774]MDO3628488.1 hypothetical protein [Mucilaginibacter sp. BT774]
MLCLLCRLSYAQQTLTIKGIIFKKSTPDRISQAIVTDLKTQTLMMSDELGGFSIKASIGDTLQIAKAGYTPQKIAVVNNSDLVVYLQPVIELNQVTIKGQSKQQELNEVMKEYRSQGIFNNGKSLPVWQFINSPITAFYNLFGKAPAQARRFAEYAKNEQEASAVDKRYTKELVKSVTKMPDDEIDKFMVAFRPSYENVKEWNDYQLIQYIKKEFAYYQKNKDRPEAKLQKLY